MINGVIKKTTRQTIQAQARMTNAGKDKKNIWNNNFDKRENM